MKKILGFTMMCLLSLSICTSCDGDTSESTASSGGDIVLDSSSIKESALDTYVGDTEKHEYNGQHLINVTDSTNVLVDEGRSEYVVLVKEDSNDEELSAAHDIVDNIFKSTSCKLQIVKDNEITDYSKVISIGETKAFLALNVTVNKENLTSSGYKIFSDNQAVFLIGGGIFGTRYMAYEFLNHEVGFEPYTVDETHIDLYSKLTLKNFDIVDVPDYEFRMSNYGSQRQNDAFSVRQRVQNEAVGIGNVWMGPRNMPWHNFFSYLPKDIYEAEHPGWYSNDGKQLCLLAHGDEAEQAAMFKAFMDCFIDVVRSNPNCENITITQEDISLWCTCDACREEMDKYGDSYAGAMIVKFCNKVSNAFKEYCKENNYDRHINICFFAYHKTEAAPVKKDSNNNYVPIDDSVICNDNVFCYYAPIYADYSKSFYDTENTTYADTLDKWKILSKEIYTWIYSTNFSHYLVPFNSFNGMQDTYKFWKSRGAKYIFDEGQYNQTTSVGWSDLKTYLNSKLAWNVNLDMNTLIDNYFTNVYKDASSDMLEMFKYYRDYVDYLEVEKNIGGNIFQNISKAEYWGKGTLDTLLSFVSKAMDKIEKYKETDKQLYDLLWKRITMESIPFRMLMIDLYPNKFASEELLDMKKSFMADCQSIGVTNLKETQSISDLWIMWGIS